MHNEVSPSGSSHCGLLQEVVSRETEHGLYDVTQPIATRSSWATIAAHKNEQLQEFLEYRTQVTRLMVTL